MNRIAVTVFPYADGFCQEVVVDKRPKTYDHSCRYQMSPQASLRSVFYDNTILRVRPIDRSTPDARMLAARRAVCIPSSTAKHPENNSSLRNRLHNTRIIPNTRCIMNPRSAVRLQRTHHCDFREMSEESSPVNISVLRMIR